jgi:drug/metabolite transporter (DMT)-like permease
MEHPPITPLLASNRRASSAPQLLLSAAALFWAGNFIAGRALRGDIPPVSLNFWRWTIALLILLPFTFARLRLHRAALLREWKLVLALGATGIALFHTAVYSALTTTPAINALLFLAISPMAIAVLSWLVFRDTITRRQAAGIAISLAGAVVVIARGDPAALAGLRLNPGDLWMLLAVLVWALYSVLLKRRPASVPPLALLTASVIAGVALLLPAYLWQVGHGETMVLNTPNSAALLYIALFASVLAFLFWNRGVAELGPTRAGMFTYLMPVFGAALAIWLLGEPIAPYHILGAALVFGGIILTTVELAAVHGHAPACT